MSRLLHSRMSDAACRQPPDKPEKEIVSEIQAIIRQAGAPGWLHAPNMPPKLHIAAATCDRI